eukprot:6180957-Pleurochrysis_carterae.AAC.1
MPRRGRRHVAGARPATIRGAPRRTLPRPAAQSSIHGTQAQRRGARPGRVRRPEHSRPRREVLGLGSHCERSNETTACAGRRRNEA